MGTYLRYACKGKNRKAAGAWLSERAPGQLSLWDELDQGIEHEKGERGCPDYLPLGVGQLKLNGLDEQGREDETGRDLIGILMEGRKKFRLTFPDLPSSAEDYIPTIRLENLVGKACLAKWRIKWKEAAEDDAVWDKAKKKAIRGAKASISGGVGPLVDTWSNDKAHLLFVGVEPKDHPRWVGIAYDRKGDFFTTTKKPEGDEFRFELLRDSEDRGFLGIPLMALGPRGMEHGHDQVRDYLARAWDVGLRTHPDFLMIAVYRSRPDKISFGQKTQQLAEPHGPYVRGDYKVEVRDHYRGTKGLDLDEEGTLAWGPLDMVPAVHLQSLSRSDNLSPERRFFATYPALAQLFAITNIQK